jgi:hypothetical protein
VAAPAPSAGRRRAALFLSKPISAALRLWVLACRLVGAVVAVTYSCLAAASSKLAWSKPDADAPAPQPRLALTQRLTTSWTHWLYSHARWLLGHPVFFGRRFPWQWGSAWARKQVLEATTRPDGSQVYSLPSLSALLSGLIPHAPEADARSSEGRPAHGPPSWASALMQVCARACVRA